MTLLVSWIGVDTHGTASAYIVADSRISWGTGRHFDHGRKVFAFRNSPDIIGYCGEVLFPTLVISQIVDMADNGLLFASQASCKEKYEGIKEKLIQQFNKYPKLHPTTQGFQLLHISRDGIDNTVFACWLIEWSPQSHWSMRKRPLPSESNIISLLGSGAIEFEKNFIRYKGQGTSRSVFQCFCDTLSKIRDPNCGGAPQLVGIYRKPSSSAKHYGVIVKRCRYFLGAIVDADVDFAAIEWRNDLFERCDGRTMTKLEGAQSQPDCLRS